MIDVLPPEARERILREQEEAARFACDAPAQEPPAAIRSDAGEPKP
jgi:hypothetical protein